MNYRYPTGILQGQLNLLDSHDVNRFFSYCKGDIRRLRLAEVFLFTAPGVPCVFYGDELGVSGGCEYALRGPMPWTAPPCDEREFFKRLISLRRENEALVDGSYRTLCANEEGLYVFERRRNNQVVTVALNARDTNAGLRNVGPQHEPILSSAFENDGLGPLGYAIWI